MLVAKRYQMQTGSKARSSEGKGRKEKEPKTFKSPCGKIACQQSWSNRKTDIAATDEQGHRKRPVGGIGDARHQGGRQRMEYRRDRTGDGDQ